MAHTEYPTQPVQTRGMPPGVPYIVVSEAAERFSFYGMNSILVVFMTSQMLKSGGVPAPMSEADAKAWYHVFQSATYIIPILGAILADAFLGKFRTIMMLSVVYCCGHLALAIDNSRVGLAIGLGLIALGAGGIKPCVSATVGDQFCESNQHLLPRVYSWFYFSINLGSAVSTLLIPKMMQWYGPHVAFGVPGILMMAATLVFWFGRRRFAHVPPAGRAFLREATSRESLKAIGNLLIIVPFVAMFWALWYQNFSSWVIQAGKMDLKWMGVDWLPEQIQTANAVLILVLLPVFSYLLYPAIERVWKLTPLRRIGIGLFLTAFTFLIPAWIETRLALGERPPIAWQLTAYVFLTACEILVSTTHLEFCYTQAPPSLKSLATATYLAAISLGNAITARVNFWIQDANGGSRLDGAAYFLFFAALMLATAIVYVGVAKFYRGKTYIQPASP